MSFMECKYTYMLICRKDTSYMCRKSSYTLPGCVGSLPIHFARQLADHCLYRFLLLTVQAYMDHLITTDDTSSFDVVLPPICFCTRSAKVLDSHSSCRLSWLSTSYVTSQQTGGVCLIEYLSKCPAPPHFCLEGVCKSESLYMYVHPCTCGCMCTSRPVARIF